MNSSADAGMSCGAVSIRVVAIRAVMLIILAFVLFRASLMGKVESIFHGSEWSHALALPVLVLVYIAVRREDFLRAATSGSNFGLFVFIAGAFLYFTVECLGLFAHLFVVAMLTCIAGAIWYAMGWRVVKLCIPLLLFLSLTMPLSERSMDRFTLGLQRQALKSAAIASKLLPGIDLNVQGKNLTYTRDGEMGQFITAEQRLGARWLPAYATIALFVVFARRRTLTRIIACLILCIPVGIVCKVLHLLVWAAVAVYGGFRPVDAMPRNVALIFAMIAMFIGAVLACGLVEKIARIPEMFVIESSDEDEAETPTA